MNIVAILALINAAIKIRAYAALRAETGMTDEELIAAARTLNEADADKLAALLAEA